MVAMVLTATASLSLLGVSSMMTASMQSITESTTSTWKLLSIFGGKMGNGGIGLNNTTMLAELPIFDTEIQILKISKPYNLFCHSWNPYSMTCGFCPGLLDLQSVGTSSCG